MPKHLYLVHPLSDYPADPSPDWEAEYRRWYSCLHHPPEMAMDIQVRDKGKDVPFNWVKLVVRFIARQDLLDYLRPEIDHWLLQGQLMDLSGRPIPGIRTLGSDRPLTIRGGPASTRSYCPICGSFLYFPIHYVLAEDLTGQPIYYSEWGLVIDESIHARLCELNMNRVSIRRLPVRASPVDGPPVD